LSFLQCFDIGWVRVPAKTSATYPETFSSRKFPNKWRKTPRVTGWPLKR